MGELIKIGLHTVAVKEYKGIRVVTFKDIDAVHERPEGTAKRNFNSNKNRLVENEDYFFVKPRDVETYEIRTSEINNAGSYLVTEQGYLMLVKSFTDDLAWEVQRKLVSSYFKQKKPLTQIEIMQQSLDLLSQHDDRIEKLENNMTIDYGQQRTIEKLVNKQVIDSLGGKESNAYKSIGKKVFAECNRDIKDYFHINSRNNIAVIDFDKARNFISNWKPCYTTELMIKDENEQCCFV